MLYEAASENSTRDVLFLTQSEEEAGRARRYFETVNPRAGVQVRTWHDILRDLGNASMPPFPEDYKLHARTDVRKYVFALSAELEYFLRDSEAHNEIEEAHRELHTILFGGAIYFSPLGVPYCEGPHLTVAEYCAHPSQCSFGVRLSALQIAWRIHSEGRHEQLFPRQIAARRAIGWLLLESYHAWPRCDIFIDDIQELTSVEQQLLLIISKRLTAAGTPGRGAFPVEFDPVKFEKLAGAHPFTCEVKTHRLSRPATERRPPRPLALNLGSRSRSLSS